MRKISFAVVLLMILVCLASCTRSAERITDHRAVPIQKAIDGVIDCDTAKYRSAFADDYDKAVSASYELTEGMAFDAFLKDIVLLPAKDAHKDNLGKTYGIEFIVENVDEYTVFDVPQEYADYFIDYSDYSVYDYELDISAIQKVAVISGKLNKWGYDSFWDDEKDETGSAKFITICVGDVWYLHPCYYFTVFN